jgi:fructosamine-3-kinase
MIWDAPDVETAIADTFGSARQIAARSRLGGGCINSATRIRLDDGAELLVKENDRRFEGLFRGEARGLLSLQSDDGPRVPAPYACGIDGSTQFIVMEYIPQGSKGRGFYAEFGSRLAVLHKSKCSPTFGYESDNHIGSTIQRNTVTESWIEFFRLHRLGYQIDLAESRGLAPEDLVRGVRGLMEKLPEYLVEPDNGSLLHGDLWGGNHMADSDGTPVVFDPAVYHGHREADLAMTELFGRFDSGFYDAYHEVFPLEPGYEERRDLYNLYHVLNHLNIFGGGYVASAARIVNRYR